MRVCDICEDGTQANPISVEVKVNNQATVVKGLDMCVQCFQKLRDAIEEAIKAHGQR